MSLDVTPRLTGLVDQLRNAVPAINADVDPAKVVAPGVWVHWTGGATATLADDYVKVDLVLMVPANELGVAIPALEDLYDQVETLLGFPDGDYRTQATTVPNSPAPLPSLVLPYLIA